MLNENDIKVVCANNGQEALDYLEQYHFDGVLMDLQMPIMDGLTASRLLRSNEAYHDLPIIALTAHALDKNRDECFDAGMNDFLTKPFEAIDLYQSIIKQLIVSSHVQTLVVEDTPVNQEILKDMMDELGMVYDIASTASFTPPWSESADDINSVFQPRSSA